MSTIEEVLLEEVVNKLSEVDIRRWKYEPSLHKDRTGHYSVLIADANTEDCITERYEVYLDGITGLTITVKTTDGKEISRNNYTDDLVYSLFDRLDIIRKEYEENLPLEKLSVALDRYQ